MWMFEQEGNYSVKSGYEAIQLWKASSNIGPSTSTFDNNVYQKLWKIKTIPRHKMILWRIINGTLPVRAELNHRGVNCPILCPRCNSSVETINHLFMKCSNTGKVWFGSQLSLRMENLPIRNFSDWLIDSILSKDDNTIMMIAALTYSLWHARNQAIF